MDVKFNLKGLGETIQNLDFSVRKVNNGANHALHEGGTIVQSAIQAGTPVGGKSRHDVHARDNVQISNVSTEGSTGYKRIRIGYGASSSWYMYFVNDGTYSKGNPKGIRPRKIVEKALDASSDAVQEAIRSVIADMLGM
ncbi:HK97 gp10 family phage protein [Aerococcaceae bacterium zg-ZJ1578]|uniref:HK97-gp10 family putative phage morphogenesis protein n=1 Tax=Aerococcaceae bacterium zg-252 TaxID=2796928 RepID=UPI001A2EC611|nr:HK97 gp10 family phage protein [Aerococcaceae bacterium zg-1578]MBR7928451.1 HK97 gp10 family phage protein [Aerococcaceae bacterium zg-ZUI334]MBS4462848.1 HK97 gp10 family phage protein [Aerococcaceae bacterium zg-B36]